MPDKSDPPTRWDRSGRLVAASGRPATMTYSELTELGVVREFVRSRAVALGLATGQVDLLVLAVSELTTNTLQHTSGGGCVQVWVDAGQLVCDVIDGGGPRAFGRAMPPVDATRGRGLAIVERVCADVTVSAGPDGTRVRLRMPL